MFGNMKLESEIIHSYLPNWLQEAGQMTEHQQRRLTRQYRRKQGIVKQLWIVTGMIMIVLPTTALIVSLALFTSFLSFCILDETQ